MGLFENLFGKQKNEDKLPDEPEHAVIIRFLYGIDGLEPLRKLENQLEKVIIENNVGEYDGHEINVNYNDGILFMYGPNAEQLFKAIRPTLDSCEFMAGAEATLRFGPPKDGVKEIQVIL